MTRPTHPATAMADERLDRLVRELLTERAEDVAVATLSADAMADRIAARLRPLGSGRAWVLLAATAMLAALLIGGTLAVGGAIRLPWLQLPAPLPSPALDGEIVSPRPSSAPDGDVRGWPDTSENPPGVYSWNGASCGISCNMGFMHNGYGSDDLEIRIDVVPERTISDDGATAVTVAGHDGIYRRIDAQRELWVVDIQGTTIAISLTTRIGTSQAELEEAHAIIGSMRTEGQDNDLGFRLLFTLTTDDWDSG